MASSVFFVDVKFVRSRPPDQIIIVSTLDGLETGVGICRSVSSDSLDFWRQQVLFQFGVLRLLTPQFSLLVFDTLKFVVRIQRHRFRCG